MEDQPLVRFTSVSKIFDWRFASRYNDSFWSEEVDRCKELAAQAVFSNEVAVHTH
jgi:hypothetical protein